MSVLISKQTEVSVRAEDFIEQCSPEDIAAFASALALKLDTDFAPRAQSAAAFADGLSELGARWLAEVVTSYYARSPRR